LIQILSRLSFCLCFGTICVEDKAFVSDVDLLVEAPSSSMNKSNMNVCKFASFCLSCCYGNEMLLLNDDVRRIVAKGFEEKGESKGNKENCVSRIIFRNRAFG
jgi:hypothetical protein